MDEFSEKFRKGGGSFQASIFFRIFNMTKFFKSHGCIMVTGHWSGHIVGLGLRVSVARKCWSLNLETISDCLTVT